MEIHINDRYRIAIGSQVGHGSTGSVHRGTDLTTNEDVAIKLEYLKGRKTLHLDLENRCYEALNGEEGIPRLRWFGQESDYNILVIDLLGSNLETLYLELNSKFTLQTILKLASQMITRVETLHRHGFVHCDIKPSNFAVGRNDQKNCIFLFDFGLTRRYIDPETGEHEKRKRCSYAGTDRFSSINTHLGYVPTRRDDLESLGYTILYFFKRTLPWQNLAGCNEKHKRSRIQHKKTSMTAEMLCEGFPMMVKYINYVRGLNFDDEPDYEYLRRLFLDIFEFRNYKYDAVWDWDKEPPAEETNAFKPGFNWAGSSWRQEVKKLQKAEIDGRKGIADAIKVHTRRQYLERLGLPSEGCKEDGPSVIVPLCAEALEIL